MAAAATPTPHAKGTPAKPWYAAGVRFECQRSGRCCTNHGEYAHVYLTRDDESRLAAHLELTLREMRRRHTRLVEGRRVLRSTAEACVFLDGLDCTVHAAKPRQCSTWPFWRDNMDEGIWEIEIAPFCPGVGKGRLWSRQEIEAILATEPAEEG